MDPVLAKYLKRYAEPEARDLQGKLRRDYQHALVVPVLGESPTLLDGLGPALENGGRTLVILVVNARQSAAEQEHHSNRVLIDHIHSIGRVTRLQTRTPMSCVERGSYDVLMVDRASAEHFLPEKQGVGLARRIGADLALGLWGEGRLSGKGFGCTDADVELPVDYFQVAEAALGGSSAALFPFKHVAGGDALVDEATWRYEVSLRYYVLGLAHAGSPYAFHSIGSTLYVSFLHYAQARGFPKRQAGEDFYLLDKLSKLAPLARLRAPTISVRARRSARVPFGTGPAVSRLLSPNSHAAKFYAPIVFDVLADWLGIVNSFAEDRSLVRVAHRLSAFRSPGGLVLKRHVEQLDYRREFERSAAQAPDAAQLRRRLHTWFDGLSTLQLVHRLRDDAYPCVESKVALGQATFLPKMPDSLQGVLACLGAAEQQLSSSVGVPGL